MDLRLTPDQDLLRASVREFAEREIRPHVMAWDEAQAFPASLVAKMADLGLMGIQYPERFGGAAMSAVDYCICIEELARVCPAVSLSVAAHNGLCSAHLFMFGSDAQRDRYLPRLTAGEMLGAWGLTESGAGSDAASMRTHAVRDGDHWVINGAKQFITHGSVGGVIVVMAVTDRTKGSKGISAFVVDAGTPGMRPGRKEHKLGMRASDTSEVIFEQCRVPADAMVGLEGQGFINTLQVLDAGRIGIAALSVGLAQGAYDAAQAYALERHQFGRPIASFQAIRWKLADLHTRIEAARLLTYRAASMKDEGAPRTSLESSIAKLYASEIAVRAAEEGVQIHGGYGFMKDYPAEKYFRDVKLCTIGEGTSEIQRLVIARQLLAAPPAPVPTAAVTTPARDQASVPRRVVLDHVGVAAADAAVLARLFGDLFDLETSPTEDIGPHRLSFVETGAATIELVEPLSEDAPVAKFIAKRGGGLHHICVRVPDIEQTMADLRAKGVTFIDAAPRQGAHGSRIAFLHPSSAAGLLLEIKEVRS